MGLTFHYSGCFKEKASLKEMIGEVKDIAEVYKWDYHIFGEVFPEAGFNEPGHNKKLYGICFTPTGCDTVCLTFLSNGRMCGPANLQFYGNSRTKIEQEYLYSLFVKTQYAGIEIHKVLIHLLKYLNKKYFCEFIVTDEGEYWETGNVQLLEQIFARYNFIIDSFVSGIENYPVKKGESIEDYFIRLMNYIHEKMKR